jgi:DNA-binding transcriptional ArsR family regulator
MKDIEQLARLFSLLGDTTRLQVVFALERRGAMCVSDLAALLKISASNLSNHLRLMRLENIVLTQRKGKQQYYVLANPALAELILSIENLITNPTASKSSK